MQSLQQEKGNSFRIGHLVQAVPFIQNWRSCFSSGAENIRIKAEIGLNFFRPEPRWQVKRHLALHGGGHKK